MNKDLIAGENFYSKILLFGEYLIVKGARGLAIPFNKFHGHLYFGESEGIGENLSLNEFAEYLSNSTILKDAIDMDRLIEDVENGIHFANTIPSGYGVGSSGALCAAIYHRYGRSSITEMEPSHLRDILALMEGFYHGISSGIDPLISSIRRPVLIAKRNHFQILESEEFPLLKNIYLLDTGIARKTAPLVHSFLKLTQDENFSEPLKQMLTLNDELINAFLNGDEEMFLNALGQLSYLQYLWLDKMIPKNFKKLWLDALESKKFYIKLCGAGGGGFLLAYSPERDFIQNFKHIAVAAD